MAAKSSKKHTKTVSDLTDAVIDGRFKLIRLLDAGSFGQVYLSSSIDCKANYAVKVECADVSNAQLLNEYRIYQVLERGIGIPRVHYFGHDKKCNYLVMDLLGPSLEYLFTSRSRTFSMKTVLMVADQAIQRLSYIHVKSLIHRDVKPNNFVMGLGDHSDRIYLIDFGLSMFYRNQGTQKHVAYSTGQNLVGTVRYSSINTHKGIQQSRRDDLEALGHVLMYFNRGSLPWQGLIAATRKQKAEKIFEKKLSTSIKVLCAGFPSEFASYLTYCRNLGFYEDPDYVYLRQKFRTLFLDLNYKYDWKYDWPTSIGSKNQRAP